MDSFGNIVKSKTQVNINDVNSGTVNSVSGDTTGGFAVIWGKMPGNLYAWVRYFNSNFVGGSEILLNTTANSAVKWDQTPWLPF
jgi:hypothetical protein